MVYHVQLAICHACAAIQRQPAPLLPSPAAGLLSQLTNKNQTLLFPAADAAPSVGCQLPLKQRECQGALQESGTMPAVPILPRNLYKALFTIYIYIYIYFLISGNKPTWTNYLAAPVLPLLFYQALSLQRKRLTVPRREQPRAVKSLLVMCVVFFFFYIKGKACLLPLQHCLLHTHTQRSLKNLKAPLSLHWYQLCDVVNLISLANNTHSPFFQGHFTNRNDQSSWSASHQDVKLKIISSHYSQQSMM